MPPPLARRLQLFTGKGGTGKTTLAAALALAHAERGKRPLLVELGHRASLASVLGVAGIDAQPREVLPGVHATNLAIGPATEALVARALTARVAARALRTGPIRTFLDAAPGVGEIATLDRLRAFVDESEHDPILVDGDATGHTRMLFALHGVLESLGVGGPVAALLDRISSVFASPELAAVHLASLPTTLAVEETTELWRELDAGGRVALGFVLLNRAEGLAATELARESMQALETQLADHTPDLASAVGLLRVDAERGERARSLARALATQGIRARLVPEVEGVAVDRPALLRIGRALLASEVRA